MSTSQPRISVWFFIGLLLATYGALILAAGLVALWRPPQPPVVLANLHFGIWWGAILLVAGLVWVVAFRPKRRVASNSRAASR